MDPVTLSWLSLSVWLWPPLRQYKTRYFVYFLCLAVSDPISHFLRWTIHSQSNLQIIVLQMIMLISLFEWEKIKKNHSIALLSLAFVITLSVIGPWLLTDLYIIIFINLVVFLIFMKRAFENLFHRNNINLFEIVLIIYELLLVTKILNIVFQFANAYRYFLITTIVQCFFALFFTIWREDDERIIFPVKIFNLSED